MAWQQKPQGRVVPAQVGTACVFTATIPPKYGCSCRFSAGFIDVEADEIAPGYAVLLMYMMLVSAVQACRGESQQQLQLTTQ